MTMKKNIGIVFTITLCFYSCFFKYEKKQSVENTKVLISENVEDDLTVFVTEDEESIVFEDVAGKVSESGEDVTEEASEIVGYTNEIIIDEEGILIDNEIIKSGSMVTADASLKKPFIICNSTGIDLILMRPLGKHIKVMKNKCFEVRSKNILREIYSSLIWQKCQGELTETDQFKKESIFECK